VEAVATQWFGVFMVASSPTDQWLINGLSGHLTSLYVRRFMGINEYNYRRFKVSSPSSIFFQLFY
jgi:transcription initiation factor TFIID subunit 2